MMNLSNSLAPLNEHQAKFHDLRIERVLAPVDFSVSTLQTLQYAGTIARRFHASLNIHFNAVLIRAGFVLIMQPMESTP
jgi:hypothetical protein